MLRRGFDIAFSSLALLVLAIPIGIVALLIKRDSQGPVFFLQPRVGRDGVLFGLFKFRTMRTGTSGPAVTAAGDPRITPLGSALRRWKIDEIPQLWNVLRGDMSVVGPRPEVERFVRHYTPAQREILRTKPGLASMAQLVFPHESDVLAASSDPEKDYIAQWMPRKIAVDLEYERRRTLLSDLAFLGEVVLLVFGFRRHQDTGSVSARRT
jgi:lipopolysaccharide/colanic/teichoic acid biosynthesis glycosyltransferase